ncbi:hypothetical protein H6P81_016963 [Aristolochia fimbriata]|uniref:WAT1-related protein n=1 Tax=Aristolochia fimbriata TaxID=158543 RepID=A0AAV7DX81_ARIFI|nr:hypothetical protein H6P81_016963 [Aristolochia fimbriata]
MSLNPFQLGEVLMQYRPHLFMILAQVGYAFLFFITEASFNHGMNPHVYVTYRHIASGIVMLPFAYFLERKIRPKLTFLLFVEIFVLSLLGISLALNLYFASLRYTSPTFLSSVFNTIASLTFIIAVALRLESLNAKSAKGLAKIFGTLISLAGVLTISLYKGPIVKNLWSAPINIPQTSHVHEEWLKGCILSVATCITLSVWFIMQAMTLKRYPAQLSLTTWMSFLGAAQSAVFTVVIQHKPSAWAIGFNIDLWNVLYGGIIGSGLIIYVQLWCTEQKGPVFVTMFNPVTTIVVVFLAYFVFGEKLYLGSIIGSLVVIIGLYLVLWGKNENQKDRKKPQNSGEEKEDSPDKNFYLVEKADIP